MEKILFWDFDGTIILPNESFLEALQTALVYCEYNVTAEEIRRFLHKVCSWYSPEISYHTEIGQSWWDNLFKHFNLFYDNHKVVKQDINKINSIFKSKILDYKTYTLFDDAVAVLSKCKEMGFENYILSNNFPELPFVIKEMGLSELFKDYIVSSNIGYEKPRKEIFQYALTVARSTNNCYMIGDNPIADIQGGKSVGMKTVLVHRGKYSDADYTYETLSDLLELVS